MKHNHVQKCKCTKCDLGGNISNTYVKNGEHTHGRKCVCTKCKNISNTSNDPKEHARNHNSVRYCNIQSAHPNNSSPQIPNNNGDNLRETKITRNPPPLSNEAWADIDTEFFNINKESWDRFKSSKEEPEKFISDLNLNLANFLKSKPEFQHKSREFFDHAPIKENEVEKMRKLKIDLNKKAKLPMATNDDIIQAKEAVRAYSHILKVNKEKEKLSTQKQEDKAYSKNFWKTAKDITNGIFGEKESVLSALLKNGSIIRSLKSTAVWCRSSKMLICYVCLLLWV